MAASVFYRGVIHADEAWIRPTPDVDEDKPAVYYTVYDATTHGERVWLGTTTDLADLAATLFAGWGFAPVAAVVSEAVRASYDAERSVS